MTHVQGEVFGAGKVVEAHLEHVGRAAVADPEALGVERVVDSRLRRDAIPVPRVRTLAGRDVVLSRRVRVKPID